MRKKWSGASKSGTFICLRNTPKLKKALTGPFFYFVWWSRSGSNRRPLECHSISGRDCSLPRPVKLKNLRASGFLYLDDTSTCLRSFLDKRRTVIYSVRLIRSQEIFLNPFKVQLFFSSVRELSVSLHGDGNGKTSKVSMMWP
jgi:hypothetical protein